MDCKSRVHCSNSYLGTYIVLESTYLQLQYLLQYLPTVAGTILGNESAPVSPSVLQKPPPRTTLLASLRQPLAPMRPISARRPGMHP